MTVVQPPPVAPGPPGDTWTEHVRTALVRRWSVAYARWGAGPPGGAATVLRRLSTPSLYAELTARPRSSVSAPRDAPSLARVQTFAAAGGFSAIVDLRWGVPDLVLDLLIVRTPRGLRVRALYL